MLKRANNYIDELKRFDRVLILGESCGGGQQVNAIKSNSFVGCFGVKRFDWVLTLGIIVITLIKWRW